MPFDFLRKGEAQPVSTALRPTLSEPTSDTELTAMCDPSDEIHDLLELELSGSIRRLQRAALSAATGAEATAAARVSIRERTGALVGRTSAAQETANVFGHCRARALLRWTAKGFFCGNRCGVAESSKVGVDTFQV